jgi:gamma-glutamylaminecyclotransferase
MMEKVFVYGTLKGGYPNHHRLGGACGIKAEAKGFELYDGPGYPFAKKGNGFVQGELYEINEHILQDLDRLEGHPRFYRREAVQVEDVLGFKHKAWMYLFERADAFPKYGFEEWRLRRHLD